MHGTYRYKPTLIDLCLFTLTAAGLLWLLFRGGDQMGYAWHWRKVMPYILTMTDGQLMAGPLCQGLLVTLQISGLSLVCAGLIGLAAALLRLSSSVVGRGLAWIYIESIRNTPLLVQIFVLYFVVAPIFGIGRTASAILALSLFEGAYACEIFRAGIQSITRGQWEACHSLGLTGWQSYRHVILPQAIRRVIPPLTSQAVSLIKDSALVSTIAVYDLTMQGRTIIAETFLDFEIWSVVAAVYLMVTLTLSTLATRLEHRATQLA